MNWDAIGALGEILGAIAVVATLLYLARQTRVSSRATISASRSASAVAISEFDRDIARDPELARIYKKSLQDPKADFDELEWLRFMTFARALVYLYEDHYMQSLEGTADPTAADIHVAAVIAFIDFPAWKEFWEIDARGGGLRPAFIEAVNTRRAQASISRSVPAGQRS